MNGTEQEKLFEERVRSLLDQTAENLDDRTRERLESIRFQAIGAPREPSRRFFIPLRWVSVGGLATASVILGLFFWLNTSPVDLPATHVEDLEIITSKDHIELFQNLDFYEWLATKENGRTKGNA